MLKLPHCTVSMSILFKERADSTLKYYRAQGMIVSNDTFLPCTFLRDDTKHQI